MFHIQENGDIRMLRLSQIAQLLNGYAFKSKNYADNGIRVIRIANVQDGYIVDDAPCFYPIDTDEDIEKYSLFAEDLLISLTGNVGRVGILPADMLPAALNQRVCCLRIDETIVDRKYLFYFLRQHQFMRDCVKASKGVAQLNLSTKWLADYEIPTPKIEEQKRIVARIEELFSELDNGVETLRKTKRQLAVYRQAVLKEAFDRVIPDSRMQTIKVVCNDIKVGIVIKPAQYYTDESNGIKAFRSANVREFRINDADWVYLTKEGHECNLRSEIHTGDVLIVRSGYPGTACVVTNDYNNCNAIDVLIAVPNTDIVTPEYLCAFTNSPYGRKLVAEKKRGVAQAHLNVGGYSKMEIPVLEISVQKQVVQSIEQRLSVYDSISKTIDTALQQAEAMRQSILKQAFEGRL